MKYKLIPNNYLPTILDRLTRFEPACVRYKRVFDDIINKFLLDEKLKNLTLDEEIQIVQDILNASLEPISNNFNPDILFKIEDLYFNKNELSYQYLSSRIDLKKIFDNIQNKEKLPINSKWLEDCPSLEKLYLNRNELGLLYPIEKIILCEGQTEYVLLETIFSLFDINLNKLGVMVIQAGGKNQVARKYYSMLEYVKLPFFILLDKDAIEIKGLINPKLREDDIMHLIKSGEFEDLIPINILLKTINYIHKNEYNCNFDDFNNSISMVGNLENIYKKYGFGEFKKAQFAQNLKEYISLHCSKNDFVNSEINEIVSALHIK